MIQRDRANTPPMAIPVVEFSSGGYKIRKIIANGQLISKGLFDVIVSTKNPKNFF